MEPYISPYGTAMQSASDDSYASIMPDRSLGTEFVVSVNRDGGSGSSAGSSGAVKLSAGRGISRARSVDTGGSKTTVKEMVGGNAAENRQHLVRQQKKPNLKSF